MVCTFFGNRVLGKDIKSQLRKTITYLIESKNVTLFYIGNNGAYDAAVLELLKELSEFYDISYFTVLAYVPIKSNNNNLEYTRTILPENIEKVPKRFAIVYRNEWMIQHSDYVVTYIENRVGSNSAKFESIAEKQGKVVIKLAEQ